MRDYKKSRNPSKMSTETFSASQTTTSHTGNKMAGFSPNGYHSAGEDMIRPAHNANAQFTVNSAGSRGSSATRDNSAARSSSVARENTSMIVQVSQVCCLS